ncbi:hypothetical protein [uncultured Brachyspira sp.]|uniref:hypothetical protein n=1 Tax=uncultured Brachyspira sp. TaxID=221953 RepID=UPI00260AA383|nr:hypothetical protein [uncultured Brachyspira sp.]
MPKKILLLLFILYINVFSQSYNIDLVKYGNFNNYPNITINEIISTIFSNVIWEDIEGVDGNRYVNMVTDTDSQKFILQFRILNNKWYINAAELNNEPYNISNIEEELYNLYQEYTGNQNNYNQNLNLSDSQFINLVKDNYFSSHRDVKVGDIMTAIFDNVKWEKIIGVDGNNYVNMNAYSDNEKVTIQFKIIDLYSWELNALEIDGIAYSTENIDNKLYDLYKKHNYNYYNDNYYNNQNNNNYYKPNNNQNFNNNNLNNNNNFNNTPDIKNNNLSYRVNIVRNNYFLPHRDATIGEIIDTVFSKLGYDVKWEDSNDYVTVNISSANNKWKSFLKFKIENNNPKLIDAQINGEKYNIETIKNDLYSSYVETKKQYGQIIKN